MAVTVYTKDGLPLLVDGKLAISDKCCCGDHYYIVVSFALVMHRCCDAPEGLSCVFTAASGTSDEMLGDCPRSATVPMVENDCTLGGWRANPGTVPEDYEVHYYVGGWCVDVDCYDAMGGQSMSARVTGTANGKAFSKSLFVPGLSESDRKSCTSTSNPCTAGRSVVISGSATVSGECWCGDWWKCRIGIYLKIYKDCYETDGFPATLRAVSDGTAQDGTNLIVTLSKGFDVQKAGDYYTCDYSGERCFATDEWDYVAGTAGGDVVFNIEGCGGEDGDDPFVVTTHRQGVSSLESCDGLSSPTHTVSGEMVECVCLPLICRLNIVYTVRYIECIENGEDPPPGTLEVQYSDGSHATTLERDNGSTGTTSDGRAYQQWQYLPRGDWCIEKELYDEKAPSGSLSVIVSGAGVIPDKEVTLIRTEHDITTDCVAQDGTYTHAVSVNYTKSCVPEDDKYYICDLNVTLVDCGDSPEFPEKLSVGHASSYGWSSGSLKKTVETSGGGSGGDSNPSATYSGTVCVAASSVSGSGISFVITGTRCDSDSHSVMAYPKGGIAVAQDSCDMAATHEGSTTIRCGCPKWWKSELRVRVKYIGCEDGLPAAITATGANGSGTLSKVAGSESSVTRDGVLESEANYLGTVCTVASGKEVPPSIVFSITGTACDAESHTVSATDDNAIGPNETCDADEPVTHKSGSFTSNTIECKCSGACKIFLSVVLLYDGLCDELPGSIRATEDGGGFWFNLNQVSGSKKISVENHRFKQRASYSGTYCFVSNTGRSSIVFALSNFACSDSSSVDNKVTATRVEGSTIVSNCDEADVTHRGSTSITCTGTAGGDTYLCFKDTGPFDITHNPIHYTVTVVGRRGSYTDTCQRNGSLSLSSTQRFSKVEQSFQLSACFPVGFSTYTIKLQQTDTGYNDELVCGDTTVSCTGLTTYLSECSYPAKIYKYVLYKVCPRITVNTWNISSAQIVISSFGSSPSVNGSDYIFGTTSGTFSAAGRTYSLSSALAGGVKSGVFTSSGGDITFYASGRRMSIENHLSVSGTCSINAVANGSDSFSGPVISNDALNSASFSNGCSDVSLTKDASGGSQASDPVCLYVDIKVTVESENYTLRAEILGEENDEYRYNGERVGVGIFRNMCAGIGTYIVAVTGVYCVEIDAGGSCSASGTVTACDFKCCGKKVDLIARMERYRASPYPIRYRECVTFVNNGVLCKKITFTPAGLYDGWAAFAAERSDC